MKSIPSAAISRPSAPAFSNTFGKVSRKARHRLGNLAPILRVDQNGSCRKRAEVDPDDIPFHCQLPGYFRFAHSGQM